MCSNVRDAANDPTTPIAPPDSRSPMAAPILSESIMREVSYGTYDSSTKGVYMLMKTPSFLLQDHPGISETDNTYDYGD